MDKTKNLTDGNIMSTLVRFAVPVLLAMFLQSLYSGVDLLIVGQFAETADVSGVATGSMLMHTVTAVVIGLAMGVTILVGQKLGARENDKVAKAIGASICLFSVIAVVLTAVLCLFTDFFCQLLHAPEEAYKETYDYIWVCGLGSAFIIGYNVLGAIFRGLGDSKTPLITVCIACVFNVAGDLFFVSVLDMGAKGAAFATIISQALSVVISLYIISKKSLPFKLTRDMIRFDKPMISHSLRLGLPLATQELLVGASFLAIQTIVNSIDVVASAGVGVAEKVCAFIMLVPSAFSQSIAAFVAQNAGAGLNYRAKRALLYGVITSLCVGVVMFYIAFFHGDMLTGIFSKDIEVILAGHSYLKAFAIDCLFTAVMFCFVGYYNGYGKTVFSMVQSIIGAIGVRVPVAFLMSRLEDTSLFLIGLSTPSSTLVQIFLCVGYLFVLKKRNDPMLR